MFRFANIALDKAHERKLAAWQKKVNAAGNYTAQVKEAKLSFSKYNKRRNVTFDHIKLRLTDLCCGVRRCAYCEDSLADEVEHMRPKDLYPNQVFSWQNYIYACGPCNGPKNNKFSVLSGTPPALVSVTRSKGDPVQPPIPGTPALLDPRVEDPLHYLFLDLANTFVFLPQRGLSNSEKLRAEYTLQVLRLNERDLLIESRKNAFRNYRARLREYIQERDAGGDVSAYPVEFRKMDHRTVWLEMQRQRSTFAALRELFLAAPEALGW